MSHEYGVGTYPVEVVAAHLGKSAKKGTPQIEIVFRGEYGDISAFRYFTEGTWQYLQKELVALGWDPHENNCEFDRLDGGDASALVGARCEIVTKQETYTDPESGEQKVSLKVQFINGQGRKREEMPEEERKPFLASLRKSVIGWSGKAPKAPAAKKPTPAERKESTRQAVADGIANQRGSAPRAQTDADGQPPEQNPEGWDSDNPRF